MSQRGGKLTYGTLVGKLGVIEGLMCGTSVGKLGVVKGNAVGVACIFSRVGMGVLDRLANRIS